MKQIVLYLLLLSTSCISQKRCNEKYPPTTSTETNYIETVKEVPVYLEGDSILIDVPVDCPDQELAEVETGKLKQTISILKGRLLSRTDVKPDTVYIDVVEVKETIREVKVPQPVKFTPKWIKILAWFGFGSGLLFIFILYRQFS